MMGRFPLKDYLKFIQALPEGYFLIPDSDAGVAQRKAVPQGSLMQGVDVNGQDSMKAVPPSLFG